LLLVPGVFGDQGFLKKKERYLNMVIAIYLTGKKKISQHLRKSKKFRCLKPK